MSNTTPQPARHTLLSAEAEEAAARALLTAPAFEFINGAAHHGEAKTRNEAAWDAVTLTPRLPVDVSRRTTEGTLFGVRCPAPIAVAPVGSPSEVRPGADLALAAACAETGIPYVIPTMGSEVLERVAAVPGLTSAFQLYWLADEKLRWELIARARHAGCKALLITVDAPGRLGSYGERWLEYTKRPGVTNANVGDSMTIDGSLCWNDIEQVVQRAEMPVYLKGVLSPQVARQAEQHGCRGVVVSNHSGRQLDAAPAVPQVLPGVAEAAPRLAMLADSGIRTGTDILRAFALGADGVLVGRQVMYGLAAGGAQGVVDVLERLTRELDAAMANTGCVVPSEAFDLLPREEW